MGPARRALEPHALCRAPARAGRRRSGLQHPPGAPATLASEGFGAPGLAVGSPAASTALPRQSAGNARARAVQAGRRRTTAVGRNLGNRRRPRAPREAPSGRRAPPLPPLREAATTAVCWRPSPRCKRLRPRSAVAANRLRGVARAPAAEGPRAVARGLRGARRARAARMRRNRRSRSGAGDAPREGAPRQHVPCSELRLGIRRVCGRRLVHGGSMGRWSRRIIGWAVGRAHRTAPTCMPSRRHRQRSPYTDGINGTPVLFLHLFTTTVSGRRSSGVTPTHSPAPRRPSPRVSSCARDCEGRHSTVSSQFQRPSALQAFASTIGKGTPGHQPKSSHPEFRNRCMGFDMSAPSVHIEGHVGYPAHHTTGPRSPPGRMVGRSGGPNTVTGDNSTLAATKGCSSKPQSLTAAISSRAAKLASLSLSLSHGHGIVCKRRFSPLPRLARHSCMQTGAPPSVVDRQGQLVGCSSFSCDVQGWCSRFLCVSTCGMQAEFNCAMEQRPTWAVTHSVASRTKACPNPIQQALC